MACLAGGHIQPTNLLFLKAPNKTILHMCLRSPPLPFLWSWSEDKTDIADPSCMLGKMLKAHSHALWSCQAVDSLINTWEEKCQSGDNSLDISAWGPCRSKRHGVHGWHLCRFHYVVTFPAWSSSTKQKCDSRNFSLYLVQPP